MFRALVLLLPLLAVRDPSPGDRSEELFKSGSLSVRLKDTNGKKISYLLLNGVHRGGNFRPSGNQGGAALGREVVGYHHRLGPAGQAMTRFNWFSASDGKNAYAADARMPASLVGLFAPPALGWSLPTEALVGSWSEPPYATVAMYVGAMAAYARPFQHVHFFEKDSRLVKLALPEPGEPVFFHFILDAVERGAEVRIHTGEPRKTLAAKAPRQFYHALFVEACPRDRLEDVAVELLSTEGIASLFETLTPKGVLCVHTSNRYVKIVPVLTDVAASLKLTCKVGQDRGGNYESGQFSSEWVMLARDPAHLTHLRDIKRNGQPVLTWTSPNSTGEHLWTDVRHSFRSLYRSDPLVMQAHQRWSESARGLFRRLRQVPGFGITERQFYEFDRFTFRCALHVSQAALQVRERWYAFADGVKR